MSGADSGWFDTLGLTEYEATALRKLLTLGRTTAPSLAEATDIPKARIYGVLESLSDRGFIKIIPGRPKEYQPKPPKEVLDRAVENRRRNHPAGHGRQREHVVRAREIHLPDALGLLDARDDLRLRAHVPHDQRRELRGGVVGEREDDRPGVLDAGLPQRLGLNGVPDDVHAVLRPPVDDRVRDARLVEGVHDGAPDLPVAHDDRLAAVELPDVGLGQFHEPVELVLLVAGQEDQE